MYVPEGDAATKPKFETESDFDPQEAQEALDGNDDFGDNSGWGGASKEEEEEEKSAAQDSW